jgi:hypothetical protein
MAILQINGWKQQAHCRSWKGYGNTKYRETGGTSRHIVGFGKDMAILQINLWNQQTHCRRWKGYGNTTDKPVEPADTL